MTKHKENGEGSEVGIKIRQGDHRGGLTTERQSQFTELAPQLFSRARREGKEGKRERGPKATRCHSMRVRRPRRHLTNHVGRKKSGEAELTLSRS
jgi:hypothetical protein